MSPTREARDAKTVELPRPASRPRPSGWHDEAGLTVHTATGFQIDDIASLEDAELAETEAFAADVVSLCQWRRREVAISRVRWTPPGGGEAA
mgnify:CR=1 FL=1